jgi:hypothetical protein
MSLKISFGAAAFGAALLASGVAYAVPTATVNGVTFPVGLVTGGNQLEVSILNETAITGSGQTLRGVGYVTQIVDNANNVTFADGQNGVRLGFVVNNYTSATVIAPTANTAGSANFFGGVANFYTLAAGTSIATGTQAGDIAAVQAGTLFLSEVAAPIDAAGHTLSGTIPPGSSLSQFIGGSGFGFLDVVGGAAAAYFNTNTIANPFDVGGVSDVRFTSAFDSGASGDFPVSGSLNIKANAALVPEPVSLSLLGAGLVGLGLLRRRKA